MSKRDQAIDRMNRLGAAGEPFLFIVDFTMERPEVLTREEALRRGVRFEIDGRAVVPSPPPPAAPDPGTPPADGPLRKFPVPYDEFLRAYTAVRSELMAGNSYLLNLTFQTPVSTPLTPEEIFRRGRARYRILLPGEFVCFSPEPFVRISDGVISSCPMKGTIDAALPDAERRVLADPKEIAEHTTIVDLIRNDLNGVAAGVRVERFRYVERVPTSEGEILQVSSLISGRLPSGYERRLGGILFELLPAGSVTGAPKRKTVEIIRRVETAPRGFYTGVAGWFDGRTLDSCVLIRFIGETPAGPVYHSGGGITVMSDPEAEYAEMVRKIYVPAL